MVATANGRVKRKNDLLVEYQTLKQKFDVLAGKHKDLIEENASHMDAI